MKIYYHKNSSRNSNCYILVNPKTKKAIIIDPGQLTPQMIDHIEEDKYSLEAVFVTHGHGSLIESLSTLRKVYKPKIYAADSELIGEDTNILKGDGLINTGSFEVKYYSVSGHTSDSMAFKIANCIFTGDALLSGSIGKTTNPYAKKLLIANIQNKIFIHDDKTIVFPKHGPLTTIASEKKFNMELGCPMLHTPIGIKKDKEVD